MNNVDIFISHDVTGCLIFGKDYEVFADYEEIQKQGRVFFEDRNDIILSKGAAETSNPLPIISALARNFIKAYKEYPDYFCEEDNPDQHMVPVILRKTIEDLNFDLSHIEEKEWIYPTSITNGEYLFQNNITDPMEAKIFPVTFEILNLLGHTTLFYKGTRINNWNSEFLEIMNEYKDYPLYLSEIRLPTFLMNQRIKQSQFKPVGVKIDGMEETQYSFAVSSSAGILTLAWAELYFANVYEMPFSLCTYCGQVYRLSKNLNKGSCGKDDCKKSLRKDRDQRKREEDPETEREKVRIRVQLGRDKKKAKDLSAQGKSVEEIRNFINRRAKKRGDSTSIRTIEEIRKWLKK